MEPEEHVTGWGIERPENIPDDRPPRRSLLFMPGDSKRKIEKASTLSADSIIMDLEDGVALERKDIARSTVVDACIHVDFGGRERLIRVNPVSGPLCRLDLDLTVDTHPDGYVIPKVESPGDLASVDHFLSDFERMQGLQQGTIRLMAIIETPLGVLNVRDITASTSRLDALMFGAEDLAGSMGLERTRQGWEVFYARSVVVMAAAAYGLQAIDTVFVDLSDSGALAAECEFVRSLGYTGKLAIHPDQLEVINHAFSPTAEEIAAAERLIAAHTQAQASGLGAFEFDGKMVDMPVVRGAQNVLKRARTAGPK